MELEPSHSSRVAEGVYAKDSWLTVRYSSNTTLPRLDLWYESSWSHRCLTAFDLRCSDLWGWAGNHTS